jgi:general stress protein 26
MANLSLHDLSEKMRDIDFVMLFTRAENGAAAGRPMSNNGDVEYEGDSYFFTYEQTDIVRDKETFKEHWQRGLERWFPDGPDTAGMVMLEVVAQRVHWWSGEDNGEIVVNRRAWLSQQEPPE